MRTAKRFVSAQSALAICLGSSWPRYPQMMGEASAMRKRRIAKMLRMRILHQRHSALRLLNSYSRDS